MASPAQTDAAPLAYERDPAASADSYDWSIILIVGALMTIGTVIVYSASVTIDGPAFDFRMWWRTPLRQGVFAGAAFVLMALVARTDYRSCMWSRPAEGWRAGGLALAAAALLILVLIPGIGAERMGAQRSFTLPLGPAALSFQPSELAKLALVVWLAAFLTRPGARLEHAWRGYAPALGGAGLLIVLTVIEDFGTAALMGVVTVLLLLWAGARWTHLGVTALLGGAAGLAFVLIEPYRWQRLTTFFSQNPDLQREGYQVNQALIAIGSGGWFGRGLGAGVQKYDYLPQDNNDFIMAIVCEELGVVGGLTIVGLFLLLLWRGWTIARQATEPFGRLLAGGLTLMICLQAAFNIGVVTNSIPTKGISLPFVSAGGSGLLFLGLAAGLLASVGGRVRAAAQSGER